MYQEFVKGGGKFKEIRWRLQEKEEKNQPTRAKMGGQDWMIGDSLCPLESENVRSGKVNFLTSPPSNLTDLSFLLYFKSCTHFCAFLLRDTWLATVPERRTWWEYHRVRGRCVIIPTKAKLPTGRSSSLSWFVVCKSRTFRCRFFHKSFYV